MKSYRKKSLNELDKSTKIGVGLLLVAIVISLMFLFICQYHHKREHIILVNNEPIYRVEFERAMREEYANTYDYFKREYGIDSDKNFWENTFDGVSPLEYTKLKVKDKLVRTKLMQILAKQRKLAEGIDYFTQLVQWKDENKRREEAIKNGEPVYGPVFLGEKQYFEKTKGELEQKIKDDLAKEVKFDETEKEKYYLRKRDKYFQKFGRVEVQYIKLPVVYSEDGSKDDAINDEIKSLMAEFGNELLAGVDFQVKAKEYEKKFNNLGFEYFSETIDEFSLTKANMTFPTVLKKLEGMQEGDVTDVLEERTAFYVVKCKSKEPVGYKTFSEVKERVGKMLIEQEYLRRIDELGKKADIEINTKVYEKVKVD